MPTFDTFKYSGVAHFFKQTLLNNNGLGTLCYTFV